MTPQTIDVTGLSPAAVEAVGRVVALLRAGVAPAAGPADPFDHPARAPGTGPPPGETAEEWIARFDAYVKDVRSRPRREGAVEIDDDRESLYDRNTD
jgi:hypothetical protein